MLQVLLGSKVELVTVYPEEYPGALRNPLKGFRPEVWAKVENNRYMTLVRDYVKWNELEQSKSDDLIANIKAYSDRKWKRHKGTGVKVIPRVYLDWDEKDGNEYWPADMETGDYTSPEFQKRVTRLIAALGECWDNDPRVAWVQMGIVGYWGEHHSPHPNAEQQKWLGKAFEKAFKNKPVLVRHSDEFEDFEFGIYWDSWAHERQTPQLMHGTGIERLNIETGRWKTAPIEGEAAYNWGSYKIQPGDDPNDTLSDPVHREFLIDTIHNLHGSALGWISKYDQQDPAVTIGADAVQRAFGYRYVLEVFSYTPHVSESGKFSFEFSVINTGSAPFYRDWPLTISFLDPKDMKVVWSGEIEEVDIRTWLPGDDWDEAANLYRIPAENYLVKSNFELPGFSQLPASEYIVALSIPDPESDDLGLRLAIKNYINPDLHPLGVFVYGTKPMNNYQLDPKLFTDPMGEKAH